MSPFQSMVTDTMTKDLDVEVVREIVDVRPIDEFKPKKPFSMIEAKINSNNERRSELKAENRNLKSYPEDDADFEDGTVFIWHADSEWGDRHFAAALEDGRWYVVGQLNGFRWDELVAAHLRKFHFSEIEVVRPAAK